MLLKTIDRWAANTSEHGELLLRQASWLEQPINFYHYRDKDKCEVDFVLEGPVGEIIGILLYDGDMTTSFGENLYAVPIAAIWG